MKTAQTKRNRVVSYLRFTASSAFFAAAAAFTFVAATTNLPSAHAASAPDSRGSSAKADAPVNSESSAIEEYSKRAYPAARVSLTQTMNAIIGVKQALATSPSTATPTPATKGQPSKKSKKAPEEAPRFNTWLPLGPTTDSDPSILTYSGAATTVSGRITALALDTTSGCTPAFCRLWVGAAGGGVWRTTNALAASPTWTFLTQLNFSTNAVGALTYDGAHNWLFAGTGEANQSADSEAGLGIFKSTDGGDTWAALPCQIGPITTISPGSGSNGTYSGNAFFGRSISKIVIDPTNPALLYVSSTRGVRGIDSTFGGSQSDPPTPRPPYGLFKSTDGGFHFSYIFDGDPSCGPGSCLGGGALSSIRGFHALAIDPFCASTNAATQAACSILYAADFPSGAAGSGGIWRSTNGGSTWTQIKSALNSGNSVDRCSFSVNNLGGGVTRMYAGCGNDGSNTAQVYRSDAVQTGAPAFTNLTAIETYTATSGYCSNLCYYDNVIYSPPGFPDVIYVGGSYTYNECAHGSDCRSIVYATNAGGLTGGFSIWADATWDAQDHGPNPGSCCNPNTITPNQISPNQHFLVTVPGNPLQFFGASDSGLVRTDGIVVDISGQCFARTYPPGTGTLAQCVNLLGVACPFMGFQCGPPNLITSLNSGLATVQFQSLAVATNNAFHVQGGAEGNGTLATFGSFNWSQLIGHDTRFENDGGQSGISVANSGQLFSSFGAPVFQSHHANFQNGNPSKWVVIGGPIASSFEFALFHPPTIADPHAGAANTIFEGSFHVWRTQDWGGSQAFLEANCPTFTTSTSNPACGDFQPLGGPAGGDNAGDLGGLFYGTTRYGGAVSVIERTTANTTTAWAANSTGRLYISTNVNANPATSVIWNRVDGTTTGTTLAANSPSRFPSGIAINPANTFQAWVSYSGYNSNTPGQAGHVFLVTWTGAGLATFTNISQNLPDIPITSVVYDPVTGDLYASSDFLVWRRAANQQFGQGVWDVAGLGMPLVEVPKLTINPTTGLLYAASHGLGGWILPLYGR